MLPALYAATLFVGATLLFLVQPLVGKLLLPLVGGTPGVWNTCMVFFQAVLLGGYLYAHAATAQLGVRRQAAAHLGVLLVVLVAFQVAITATGSPVAAPASLIPEDEDYPIVGVVTLLAVAVGVPFFVLSTTSPLLQRWFASTGHPSARDPYFLYAASNAGSLLGLLGYPFLIEPWLTLPEQRWVWAVGVVVYLGLVFVCALTVIRGTRNAERETGNGSPDAGATPPETPDATGAGLSTQYSVLSTPRILRWVGLAALPSSLLLGVTTHVSTDLAPVPLLWVVPLALYLLSFILVFARWPDPTHRLVGRITPMLLLFVVLSLLTGAAEPLGLVGGLHLAAFFGVCLVCHGELARDRPPPEQLTVFYFWLSFGGVLGGLTNALIAPLVFHRLGMVEYPLALALAALVRPRPEEPANGPPLRIADGVLLLVLLGVSVGLVLVVPRLVSVPAESDSADALAARLVRGGLMFGLPAVAAFALVRKPVRYALALGALLIAGALDPGQLGQTLHKERNFFGVVRVTRSPEGKFVRLVHGTTLHGQQRVDEWENPRPMTYYHERGPIGRVFATLPPERIKRVAVVGLGTGAVAAYAKPGQDWTFYEIDPAVVRIARDPQYFTFLASCRASSCEVVLGDARRQLVLSEDGQFDLIILDAFSSDAIPVHLLTREALQLYVQKLAPGGVLAMHVSNVHLDLKSLVGRLAADHDPPLHCRYCHDLTTDGDKEDGKTDSEWMVLARSEADLRPILAFTLDTTGRSKPIVWDRVSPTPGPVWRDDFANLLAVWKRQETE
ncbi:MAG TPA: fused MFS/spermidine synthase [Gemmataceae bacterium]|nr:fused MFS/spermidine synthase [Gemmataceae bacterium]